MNPDHSTVKEYSNIIRRLAKSGRSGYNHYLIKPLTTWGTDDETEIEKYLARINIEKRKQCIYALPELYKKAISRAVAPDQFDMSRVGSLCIEFLKEMEKDSAVLNSFESRELFSILSSPFSQYRDEEFQKTNVSLKKEMMTASPEDVAGILKRTNAKKEEIIKRSETLLNEIIADVLDGGSKYASLSVQYLVKMANAQIPDIHKNLEVHLNDIGILPEKIKELFKNTAVIIYHEIIKSIRTGDLKKAIALISKYTIIFRGNPKTPYFHEVDNFEKNLFKVIEEKNLWDSMD